jgi:hypothetical protein
MRGSRISSSRAPSAAAGIAVAQWYVLARQSTSRHHTASREKFAIRPAIAMIGASRGPNASMSAGISMMEAPKPTMALSVPEARPSARIATQVMRRARAGTASAALAVPPLERPLLAPNLQRNGNGFQPVRK